MELKLYQVDAFANDRFKGNPAAVCPLKKWIDDEVMQNIAFENNLSETAFFVRNNDVFEIRWFTPKSEVNLCGHATLASAFVIFELMEYDKNEIEFSSKSGKLFVSKNNDKYMLDFPAQKPEPDKLNENILKAFRIKPLEVLSTDDLLVVFKYEEEVRSLQPDFSYLEELDYRGIIVTARGNEYDFVSRFFAPKVGINEDPVTGSAHCKLVPYWAEKLNKSELKALQVSERTGELFCELKDDRVLISGKAVLYLEGTIYI